MNATKILSFVARQAGEGAQPRRLSAGRRDLAYWFHKWGFQTGAEIGVWAGHYSQQLCQVNPGLRLTCVDPWVPREDYRERKNDVVKMHAAYAEAINRLAPFDCTLRRMTSLEAAALVPDASLDFVYIDGNHAKSFVEADLAAWVPKVRTGGIVAGHDYELRTKRSPWIDVPEVVDAWTSQHRIAPWFVLTGDKSPSYFWVQA